MIKNTLALLVFSGLSLPVMAAGLDLNVAGTIEPVACTLLLPGGNAIDYNVINPVSLKENDFTLLSEKEINIELNCAAPVKIALMALNKRPNSMAGSTEGPSGSGTAPVNLWGSTNQDGAGLGLDGSAKIGGYGIRLKQGEVTADGVNVDVLVRGAAASAWIKSGSGVMYNRGEKQHISWGKSGTLFPIAFQNMAGKLNVQAYINKKSALDMSRLIMLDGMTTLEMVYL